MSDDLAHPQPPFEAYTGEEAYIFVSYSHRDAGFAYPEIERLDQLGYRIWYDEGIDPGNEWPDEVARALEGCGLFLVLISPHAVDSKNVRNEINYALNRSKPFIAVHLLETKLPSGLELRMGDIQAIMKYRMTDDRYRRQMEKALPEELRRAKVDESSRTQADFGEASMKTESAKKPAEEKTPMRVPREESEAAAGTSSSTGQEKKAPEPPKEPEPQSTLEEEAAAHRTRVRAGVGAAVGVTLCVILNVVAASSSAGARHGVKSTADFVVVIFLGIVCGAMVGACAMLARGPFIGAILGVALSLLYSFVVIAADPFTATMTIPFFSTLGGLAWQSYRDKRKEAQLAKQQGEKTNA